MPITRQDALLRSARAHFGVPEATTIVDVTALLETWGASELAFQRFAQDVVDEFVDESLVAILFTIADADLLNTRATAEEREMFVDDDAAAFDPLEYGRDQAEWTLLAHEIETLGRALIIVEHASDDASRVGNFRVIGGAQWLRESLWAATGIVPRDPGAPDENSTLFGEAFPLADRAPFSAAPLDR